MDEKSLPLRRDAGGLSGNETQYLFSEGDMRDSDADLITRPARGMSIVLKSFKLSRNIILTDRLFSVFVFSQLSFS